MLTQLVYILDRKLKAERMLNFVLMRSAFCGGVHFDSCQLTLIWLAHITLNYWQPTGSPARRSFVFMLNW